MPKQSRERPRRHAAAAGAASLGFSSVQQPPPARPLATSSQASADLIAALDRYTTSAQTEAERAEAFRSKLLAGSSAAPPHPTATPPSDASSTLPPPALPLAAAPPAAAKKSSPVPGEGTAPLPWGREERQRSKKERRAAKHAQLMQRLMLPGDRLKLARRQPKEEGQLPSLLPLTEALPLSLCLPGSPSISSTTVASVSIRTAKQRAALRVREVDQLRAVLSYDGYRQNPIAVMREHIQAMMAKEKSEGGQTERATRGTKRAPSHDASTSHAQTKPSTAPQLKGKRRKTT